MQRFLSAPRVVQARDDIVDLISSSEDEEGSGSAAVAASTRTNAGGAAADARNTAAADFGAVVAKKNADENTPPHATIPKDTSSADVIAPALSGIARHPSVLAQLMPGSSSSSSSSVGPRAPLAVLEQCFGFTAFRGAQEAAITAVMSGRDALVIMPTGGGKSVCYQVPGLCHADKVTVVVCPLLALARDQVQGLNRRAKQTVAAALHSAVSDKDKNALLADLYSTQPSVRLLYVTPEGIAAGGATYRAIKRLADTGKLALFAVDEAHCISSWGHDFRGDYRRLSTLRDNFPSVPIIALTATATAEVQEDIRQQLKLSSRCCVLKGSFDRPNLQYQIVFKKLLDDAEADLAAAVAAACSGPAAGSAIIYANKKADCEALAAMLAGQGLSAAAYHAGLKEAERSSTQDRFAHGELSAVVATISFGMGVDKADVRLVAHWNMPKSIEGMYQEQGRAGRDGLPSTCRLYYSTDDKDRLMWLVETEAKRRAAAKAAADAAAGGGSSFAATSAAAKPSAKRPYDDDGGDASVEPAAAGQRDELAGLRKVGELCETPACRRAAVLKHFGETGITACKGDSQKCDYCTDAKKVEMDTVQMKTGVRPRALGPGGKSGASSADDGLVDEDGEVAYERLQAEGGAGSGGSGSRAARRALAGRKRSRPSWFGLDEAGSDDEEGVEEGGGGGEEEGSLGRSVDLWAAEDALDNGAQPQRGGFVAASSLSRSGSGGAGAGAGGKARSGASFPSGFGGFQTASAAMSRLPLQPGSGGFVKASATLGSGAASSSGSSGGGGKGSSGSGLLLTGNQALAIQQRAQQTQQRSSLPSALRPASKLAIGGSSGGAASSGGGGGSAFSEADAAMDRLARAERAAQEKDKAAARVKSPLQLARERLQQQR